MSCPAFKQCLCGWVGFCSVRAVRLCLLTPVLTAACPLCACRLPHLLHPYRAPRRAHPQLCLAAAQASGQGRPVRPAGQRGAVARRHRGSFPFGLEYCILRARRRSGCGGGDAMPLGRSGGTLNAWEARAQCSTSRSNGDGRGEPLLLNMEGLCCSRISFRCMFFPCSFLASGVGRRTAMMSKWVHVRRAGGFGFAAPKTH